MFIRHKPTQLRVKNPHLPLQHMGMRFYSLSKWPQSATSAQVKLTTSISGLTNQKENHNDRPNQIRK